MVQSWKSVPRRYSTINHEQVSNPMSKLSVFTRKPMLRGALLAALLGGTALVGVAGFDRVYAADTAITAPGPTLVGLADFSGLVTHVKPAVVSITTEMRQDASDQQGIQTPFGMMRPSQPRNIEARGSGFVVSADGLIVTNNHMVKDARSVSVTFDDGTKLSAKIIGRDPRTDLAVLKVNAGHSLPFLKLGDSAKVEPGQWVVAVGNPFGLGGTVTAGIVSARGRNIGSGPYDDFLQIDAPINQGNSGGPLFTQNGEVVGVNTAILSPSGGSVGIGFAIPSDMVKTVIAQLEKTGHVTRGYLGVESQSVDSAMAAAMKLPQHDGSYTDANGALVASVSPGSPAAKAGLQPGDVIQSVNGTHIGNARDLAVQVAEVKPGAQAALDIFRDGASKTVDVTVTTMPGEQVADSGAVPAKANVGLALAPLSPDMRDQLDIPAGTRGAVVAQVRSDSPAAAAGIQRGDLIVGVGDKAVHSVDEAASAIHAAEDGGKAVALRIMRDGHAAYVAVDLANSTVPVGTAPGSSDDNSDNG
jgi:serine protease Do